MGLIKVGDYLFKRLHELGIRSVFGVPGDYELALLDLVTDNKLDWKGNANELIASYAADGYARVNGAAAYVTTFGPGELSAYCGMAGHYAEFVPVVHIVGYPTVSAQRSQAIMHHSLGNGRFDMYENMAKHITAATTVISHPPTAASEIDRVLNIMMLESRPVYIGLSVDIAFEMISDAPLSSAITTKLPLNDAAVEQKLVGEIISRIDKAARPIIIVDGGAVRHNFLPEVEELVKLTSFPTFVTAMGKSGVSEELPNFGGLYGGAGSYPDVKAAVESADAALWFGNFPSDFNTGEFTTKVRQEVTIDFQRFFIKLGEVKYNVVTKHILGALVQALQGKSFSKASTKISWDPYPTKSFSASDALKQDFLWPSLGPFFRPGDVVIGETGTSAFGLCDSRLPSGVQMFNQTVFGSIGYATGSIVGVGQAIKESQGKWKRPILVTGEGSMHLTVQAIADMLRWDLNPIIFVLNNGGYTVERLIHGKEAFYNDVAIYDYSALARAFGPAYAAKYHGPVKTCGDLTHLLQQPDFGNAGCFELVELVLGRLDAPTSVIMTGKAIDEFNKAAAQKGQPAAVPGG